MINLGLMNFLASVSFSLKWNIITLTEFITRAKFIFGGCLVLITAVSVTWWTLNKLLSFLFDYHIILISAQWKNHFQCCPTQLSRANIKTSKISRVTLLRECCFQKLISICWTYLNTEDGENLLCYNLDLGYPCCQSSLELIRVL